MSTDETLPVQVREENGLWKRGRPTQVRIFNLGGELVGELEVPSTASAAYLTERTASWLLLMPSRVLFTVMSLPAQNTIITQEEMINLQWLTRFEPKVDVQVTVKAGDFHCEYGWRVLRHWKQLTVMAMRMFIHRRTAWNRRPGELPIALQSSGLCT